MTSRHITLTIALSLTAFALLAVPRSVEALIATHDCSFCHDFHGAPSSSGLLKYSSTEVLCLTCHTTINGSTQAASIHNPLNLASNQAGYITCRECHNPHDNIDSNIKLVGYKRDPQTGQTFSVPTIRVETTVSPPPYPTYKPVTFTSMTDFNVADAGISGSCEVCHSGNHNAGQDCTGCHGHEGGFMASCAGCHDSPPATNAHLKHAGTGAGQYAYACTVCHPQDHDGTAADIAFTGLAATWGGATYSSALKQCSNLYCHGSATADWDAGTGGACGDCHGAAGTGRPNGVDEPPGGSHLTASHQVACTNCHTHDGSDTTQHVNGPANANGDALVSAAGSSVDGYTYGSAPHASSPDPDGYRYTGGTCANTCHSTQVWGGSMGCTSCHNGGGPGAKLVSVNSSHSTNTITGAPTCESCHFTSHGVRTSGTVSIPWDARTMGTLTAAEDALDGKIYVKAYVSATLGTATSEAEACWYCHTDKGVSEWNSTPSNAATPGPRPAGYLSAGGPNWIGATWSSANFSYKAAQIESVHETQYDLDTGTGITVHDTTGGAGSHSKVSAANTDVAKISCTVCHDVHSIGDDNADLEPAPYLRGSWTSNPFPEDGAPLSGNTNISSFGGVPRGGKGTAHPLSWATNNALGGWQIEQNNANFADTSYASFGGLCQKCHSQSALETRWAPHGSVVSGFTGGGSNIFRVSYRADSRVAGYGSWALAYMRHDNTTGANGSWVYGLRNPETKTLPSGTATGITPRISPTRPETGTNLDLSSSTMLGLNVDDGTTDTGYHSFPCAKCHDPHASRLPKLMVTNCLDIARNTWDNSINPSGWTASGDKYTAKQLAYSSTAVNCHRYVKAGDTNAEDKDVQNNLAGDDYYEPGWNAVTPW